MFTKEEINKRIKNANIDMEMMEEFTGKVRDYHLFKCNKCGEIYKRRLDHVFDGRGCKFCKFAEKPTIDKINEISHKYNFKLVGKYERNFIKTKWKCLKCNKTFFVVICK